MDMKALKRASDGEPNQLIAVKRSLLANAYLRIKELESTNAQVSPGVHEGSTQAMGQSDAE